MEVVDQVRKIFGYKLNYKPIRKVRNDYKVRFHSIEPLSMYVKEEEKKYNYSEPKYTIYNNEEKQQIMEKTRDRMQVFNGEPMLIELENQEDQKPNQHSFLSKLRYVLQGREITSTKESYMSHFQKRTTTHKSKTITEEKQNMVDRLKLEFQRVDNCSRGHDQADNAAPKYPKRKGTIFNQKRMSVKPNNSNNRHLSKRVTTFNLQENTNPNRKTQKTQQDKHKQSLYTTKTDSNCPKFTLKSLIDHTFEITPKNYSPKSIRTNRSNMSDIETDNDPGSGSAATNSSYLPEAAQTNFISYAYQNKKILLASQQEFFQKIKDNKKRNLQKYEEQEKLYQHEREIKEKLTERNKKIDKYYMQRQQKYIKEKGSNFPVLNTTSITVYKQRKKTPQSTNVQRNRSLTIQELEGPPQKQKNDFDDLALKYKNLQLEQLLKL